VVSPVDSGTARGARRDERGVAGCRVRLDRPAQLWVAVSALNLISAVIILHAVVWRRWPVSVDES
jgi:hypothetical protein